MKTFRSKLALGIAAAAALCATSAQAAITFSFENGFPDTGPAGPGWNVVMTYDSPGSFFTESGAIGQIAVGDVDDQSAAPRYDGTKYAYVLPGQSYTLDGPIISGFSVFIGSLDKSNSIAFYNGDTLIKSFAGVMLDAGADGDRLNDRDNRRWNFAMNGAQVNRVVFSASSRYPMEWDTIAVIPGSAAPEPATWAMMITGFGLMGAALRRRRATIAAA